MKYKEIDIENQRLETIKYQRISESYPPDTINNQRYLAEVHHILQQIDINQIDQKQDIKSRPISGSNDIRQIQALHSEWFPVKYEQSYFDGLMTETKNLVLELDLTRFGFGKYIIASIIYVKRSTKFSEMRFRMKEICDDSYCYYIQTIGVINEFRKHGLATILIDHLKQKAKQTQRIKYISLHMVTYNQSGERFYLKNGFKVIDKVRKYYFIEQKQYDSFFFCYYVNGGEPPISFFGFICYAIKQPINSLKSLVSKSSSNHDQNDIKMI